MHEAVAGHDARPVAATRERYLETYWSRWPDVWWHGDFASVSDDGQWFLHGRSDDTIKLAGKRLGPAEVETVVVAHPSVVEAAAVGVPDEVKGEALWVFVVLGAGVDADDALRAELSRSSSPSARARRSSPPQVRFTTALPKTRSAKVLRRAIRAVVTGDAPGDLSGLEDPATLDAIAHAHAEHDELVGARVRAAAVAGRRLGRAGARCGCAAATGSSGGSRVPSRAAPIPVDSTARRSAPGAARGNASATSTPPTASACSSPTAASRARSSLGSVQRGPFQMGYVGYWIDEALAGHGYVPEGVVLLHALRVRGAATCTGSKPRSCPATRASRRVAEKLGLRDEGTAERFLQIQGVYEDHIRYAITAEEWHARGAELVAQFLTLAYRGRPYNASARAVAANARNRPGPPQRHSAAIDRPGAGTAIPAISLDSTAAVRPDTVA